MLKKKYNKTEASIKTTKVIKNEHLHRPNCGSSFAKLAYPILCFKPKTLQIRKKEKPKKEKKTEIFCFIEIT